MTSIAIIPARYNSTRYPGKPLVKIAGKSMLQRVYEQSKKFKLLDEVLIATDDSRIFEHAQTFTDSVLMTSPLHLSGTDRCAEALSLYEKECGKKVEIVLNIQGDEPFIHPEQIALLYHCFDQPSTQIATLCKEISKFEELVNPNVVKLLFDKHKQALYFSRSPLPHIRDVHQDNWLDKHTYYKHIGLYGFRGNILSTVSKLKPSNLEKAESLEQLRWLESGYSIRVDLTERESYSVDSPEDIKKLGF